MSLRPNTQYLSAREAIPLHNNFTFCHSRRGGNPENKNCVILNESQSDWPKRRISKKNINMKITICGSMKFADKLVEIYNQLKELGYEPLMHKDVFGIADGTAKELI